MSLGLEHRRMVCSARGVVRMLVMLRNFMLDGAAGLRMTLTTGVSTDRPINKG